MSFLYCNPCVFVIGNEYEILVLSRENGLMGIRIGDLTYYELSSGALSTEKSHARIRVPQAVLDAAGEYRVFFRRSVNRRAYFSILGDELEKTFSFKPVTKTDGINIYHISDVHYRFETALRTCSYFGYDLDLLVVNGDIGEVETVENYKEVAKFVADVTGGGVPTVFVRGNHDTRGRLAELYTDYFPSENKNTFFTFEVGCIHGIAYDCGEDKSDLSAEYGGVNCFEAFRNREDGFFRSLQPKDKLTLAIGHICLPMHTDRPNSVFDIERERYAMWSGELERVNVSLMLCGHYHRAFILERNDKRSFIPHSYPVVIATACTDSDIIGTAITVSGGTATVCFTDSLHNVIERHVLDLKQ